MRRNIIVERLIKEGLSETTLVKLNDKQLGQLAERMLGEQSTPSTGKGMTTISGKNPAAGDMAKNLNSQGVNVTITEKQVKMCDHCNKPMTKCSCDDSHMDEELKGNQTKIDKNHNGKIDADDFKLLNKEKQHPKETKEGNKFSGELAKAKSQHKDSFDIDGKKYDVKESKKCVHCNKEMSKCSCDDSHLEENRNIKNWVNNLAENKLYHSFTSKNEIMELIQTKLNESATMKPQFGSKVKQGHNGIPEFMSYEAITSSGPATAPTKPTTKPGTKPGEKPKKDNPYSPKPGPNHKPKALGLSERKSGPATAPTKPKPTTKPGTKPKKDNPYSPKPGPNHKPKALGEKKVK